MRLFASLLFVFSQVALAATTAEIKVVGNQIVTVAWADIVPRSQAQGHNILRRFKPPEPCTICPTTVTSCLVAHYFYFSRGRGQAT